MVVTVKFQMFKLDLEKAEEPEIKLPTSAGSWKTSQSNHTRTTALSNSMKLSHALGATQDGRVMVERSNRMWSNGLPGRER